MPDSHLPTVIRALMNVHMGNVPGMKEILYSLPTLPKEISSAVDKRYGPPSPASVEHTPAVSRKRRRIVGQTPIINRKQARPNPQAGGKFPGTKFKNKRGIKTNTQPSQFGTKTIPSQMGTKPSQIGTGKQWIIY